MKNVKVSWSDCCCSTWYWCAYKGECSFKHPSC